MDLRANTSVDVLIGPFVDKTDGNTTEDALTLTAAEIKLSKNGQALTLKSDVTAAAFDDDGYYNCELDATDTDTEGQLVLIVHQSANALPVRHEYNVMAEAAWDSLYAAKDTGFMDVNVKAIGEDTTAPDNLATVYDGVEGFFGAYAGPRGPGVYLNDAAANTNTVNGVDGTVATPVSTIAAAKTIADSMSLDRIYLVNDSTITLAATMEDYEFIGLGEMSYNTINLGTQDVDHSEFRNVLISGAQGGTARIQAIGCVLSAITSMEITAEECVIADGTSLVLRNDCAFLGCSSAVSGAATPTLDINSVANVNVYFRHNSGGMQIDNAVATTVISYDCPAGQLVIDATCTSLTVVVRGNCKITDNGTTTSIDDEAAINRTNIKAEADTALSDYDPPTKAEMDSAHSTTDGLITTVDGVVDGTAAKLVGITLLAEWLGAMAGKQASDATAQTEMRATGAGSGGYLATADSLEANRDNIGTTGAAMTIAAVTGAVGSVTGAVGSVAGNVDGNVTGSVGSLAAQAKADVNAEVDTALATTTYAEPASVPAATASLKDKIGWLEALARNKGLQTATTKTLRNDADGADIAASAISDDGTTFTRGKYA